MPQLHKNSMANSKWTDKTTNIDLNVQFSPKECEVNSFKFKAIHCQFASFNLFEVIVIVSCVFLWTRTMRGSLRKMGLSFLLLKWEETVAIFGKWLRVISTVSRSSSQISLHTSLKTFPILLVKGFCLCLTTLSIHLFSIRLGCLRCVLIPESNSVGINQNYVHAWRKIEKKLS